MVGVDLSGARPGPGGGATQVLLVAMNLIVDLAYSVIDPRVRLQ